MSAGGNACPLTVFSTTPKGVLGTCVFKSLYRFSSWPFDLNGEANRVRKKQSGAIIAVNVRRFANVINKDEVFGTHNGSVRGARGNSRPYRDRRQFITLLGGVHAGV